MNDSAAGHARPRNGSPSTPPNLSIKGFAKEADDPAISAATMARPGKLAVQLPRHLPPGIRGPAPHPECDTGPLVTMKCPGATPQPARTMLPQQLPIVK
jgi:hypothetical protein